MAECRIGEMLLAQRLRPVGDKEVKVLRITLAASRSLRGLVRRRVGGRLWQAIVSSGGLYLRWRSP